MKLSQLKLFIENNILDNAYNEQKSKESSTITTPKEDKYIFSDLAEVDICSNIKYSNHFIKCFFIGTKKSYRIEIDDIEDLKVWTDFQYQWYLTITESRKLRNEKGLTLAVAEPTATPEDENKLSEEW